MTNFVISRRTYDWRPYGLLKSGFILNGSNEIFLRIRRFEAEDHILCNTVVENGPKSRAGHLHRAVIYGSTKFWWLKKFFFLKALFPTFFNVGLLRHSNMIATNPLIKNSTGPPFYACFGNFNFFLSADSRFGNPVPTRAPMEWRRANIKFCPASRKS